MPPYDNVTIYFLKDLVSGNKRCKSLIPQFFYCHFTLDIKGDAVCFIQVPQYDKLSLEKIWEFCGDYPEVNKFLPDD